jgi:hypothetical protein
MSVGIKVGSIIDEIGAPSFVHAFFSTISAHCEPQGWGTQLPHLINELYQGTLSYINAAAALEELKIAKTCLSKLSASKVVWDIENKELRPPWGTNIAETITDLGNYFISSTGRDVFALLMESLEYSIKKSADASLESY